MVLANIGVTGGSGTYTYLWSPGLATTAGITSLCAGTYTVTVTDQAAAGCTQTANAVLTNPAAIVLSGTSVNATCGALNGSATVNITSGGVSPYNYVWSNGPSTLGSTLTSNTNTGVGAGAYTVTVTIAGGCTSTYTVNVGSTGAPTATISASSNPVCFGQCNGSATVTLGGTLNPPYNYVWSNGTSTIGSASTTNIVNTLCTGTTSVVVTDGLGCSIGANVSVTQPTVVSAATSTVNAHCNHSDGSATVIGSGGTGSYTYLWSTTAGSQTTATATNLAPGTYSVTVKDANLCSVVASATVSNTAGVVASISSITNVSCAGGNNGAATASPAGNTYAWPATAGSQVTQTASNLAAGTYIVTVTDINACTSVASATITAPTTVTATISTFTNVSCFGVCNGTATVTPGGGTPPYTYFWTNSQAVPNATGLCNGVYSVTVRDVNSCSAITSVTITQPTVLGASTTTVTAHCGHADGSATVTATGGTLGYTYLWSGGGQVTQTASSIIAGNYTVTVTDSHGCTVVANATIGNTAGGTASISSSTNVSCSGLCNGAATVSMAGGTLPYTYIWSNGGSTNTITSLCAGTYIATVSDVNACTSTATVTITSPTPLAVNITVNDVSCAGQCTGFLTSVPSGGTPPYSNLWSNSFAGAVNNNLCAGSYTVTVTDSHSCTVTATASITAVPPIILTATPTSAHCNQNDGALDLSITNGNGPFTFVWLPSGTTEDLTSIPAGSYSVTVTDFKLCTATGTFNVSNISGPSASISSFTNVTCNSLCNGIAVGSVSSGTPPFNYLWSNGQTSQTATGLCLGSYTFQVTDATSCVSTANVTITQPNALSVLAISSVSPACNGDCNGTASVIAAGGIPPYQYQWSGGVPFGGANPTNATTTGICNGISMTVTITDANLCTITGATSVIEPTFMSLTNLIYT